MVADWTEQNEYGLLHIFGLGWPVQFGLALVMLVMLRVMQMRWTRTWAEKGGRARTA